MRKVKITSDSISDLDYLFDQRGITRLPIPILLGDKEGLDGEITPDDIYKFFAETKTTPKTSAITPEKYYEFFSEQTADGSELVHFTISSKMSSCYSNACKAAEQCGGVYVIDSQNLSTGIGLQVLRAAELAGQGLSAREIVAQIERERSRVRASFVIERLDYLAMGGRCSAVAALLGGKLKLKPRIEVTDGKMQAGKKYRGNQDKVILKYVQDMEDQLRRADPHRVFITHSGCEEAVLRSVEEYLKGLHHFEEILITRAGGVISSHCGPGTLGVLFYEGG